MSGNPFRRSRVERLPDEIPDTDSNANLGRASPPKTKKPKKRVQIVSPPQSPVETYDGANGIRREGVGWAAPTLSSSLTEEAEAVGRTEDQSVHADSGTQHLGETSDSTVPHNMQTMTGARAPYNPFARTLATSEAAFGLQREDNEVGSRREAGPSKMNVDMFKNILLHGSPSPSPPVGQLARPQDSSSGTDTSSVSRQSIFDHTHELHPESPRSSYDHAESSDDDDQTEHSSLMGPNLTRPEAEGPPLPPKHTHGRAVRTKGPQTVSFADFDQSIPNDWRPPARTSTPPPNSPLTSILRPSSPRSPTNLNKPLPPPPEAVTSGTTAAPMGAVPDLSAVQPINTSSEDAQTQVKKPPPPPARRQAQTSYGRPRSSSNLTQSSTQDDVMPTVIPPTATALPSKMAPPPPPTRRAAQPSSVSDQPTAPMPPQRVQSDEARPIPPPPRRQHSRSSVNLTRTPSNSSHTSIARSENSAAPPAPPPRRTAGSARNSIDGAPTARRWSGREVRRTSEQSVGSDVGSLHGIDESLGQREVVGSDAAAKVDVLADLERLQAEVDALRVAQERA